MSKNSILACIFVLLNFFATILTSQSQVLENYDLHLSYLPSNEFYTPSEGLQVRVDLNSFPLSTLMVRLPKGSSLFIENILWYQSGTDTVQMLPLSQIRERLDPEATSAELTIYQKGIQKRDVSVQKIGPRTTDLSEGSEQLLTDAYAARTRDIFDEFFYTALLILMLLAALLRVVNPLVLPLFLNPLYLVSAEDFSEGNSFTKFFNNALLYYLLILNMLLMLLFLTVSKQVDITPLGIRLSNDMNHYFFLWIAGTLVLMLASVLKFMWLRMNVFVFGISRFEIPHFLFILRVLSFSLVLILCLMLVVLANGYSSTQSVAVFFSKAFSVYYLLCLMLLVALMRKRLSFKNYHLFSYICTSELIPFLVISRLLIG